jgi:ribosomal protein S1
MTEVSKIRVNKVSNLYRCGRSVTGKVIYSNGEGNIVTNIGSVVRNTLLNS